MKTKPIIPSGVVVLIALLGIALNGCHYMAYQFAGLMPPEKIQAEYDDLQGRTVAIAIYADQAVQYEYPLARLELALVIAAELKNRIKKLSVVEPRRVVQYQDENVHWDTLDKTHLARTFGADVLLLVVLDEFTTREPGSVNLFRGRISAQASIYDATADEDEACVWSGEDFRVLYPPHAPTGEPGEDDSQIRYLTEKLFADLLVKKFYDHDAREDQ